MAPQTNTESPTPIISLVYGQMLKRSAILRKQYVKIPSWLRDDAATFGGASGLHPASSGN
jgi:hypothetical protein